MANPGDYQITGGMPDGADVTTLTFRAFYGGATVDQTISVSKAKAGGAGTPGAPGTAGGPAIVISASKPSLMVLTYAEGTPVDPAFTGIDGYVTVLAGPGNDVTTQCTLSAVTSGCTAAVNTALNVPFAAHAMGYYHVTGMSSDTATITLSALYLGHTYSTVVTIIKAKGGYEIVGSLPTTNLFEGRIVFLTTDGKLYRCHLGIWTTAVPALDIAGTLLDAQIASLAASKLTGTLSSTNFTAGQGAAINDDPMFADPTAWKAWLWGVKPNFNTVIGGVSGATEVSSGSTAVSLVGVRGIPVSAGKTYRLSCWVNNSAGTGPFYLRLSKRDANNVETSILATFAEAVVPPLGVWTKYAGLFVSGGAPFVAPGIILNYLGTGGNMQCQDLRIEEVIGSDLIVAGGVTAINIAAGAIQAGKIAAGAVQAGNVAAGAIQAGNIQALAIVAGDIAANTLTGNKMSAGAIITASAQITDGVIISAKIGNLQVNSAQIADLTVGTTKITGNAVTRNASAALSSAVGLIATPATVLSLAYTPDTTADVRIDWVVVGVSSGTSAWGGSGPALIVQLYTYQSGVETYIWSGTFSDGIGSGSIIDTTGNTVARTYRLKCGATTGTGSVSSGTVLFCTEMKK